MGTDDLGTLCDGCNQPLENVYDERLIDLALCAQCNRPGEVVNWLVSVDERTPPVPHKHQQQDHQDIICAQTDPFKD